MRRARKRGREVRQPSYIGTKCNRNIGFRDRFPWTGRYRAVRPFDPSLSLATRAVSRIFINNNPSFALRLGLIGIPSVVVPLFRASVSLVLRHPSAQSIRNLCPIPRRSCQHHPSAKSPEVKTHPNPKATPAQPQLLLPKRHNHSAACT